MKQGILEQGFESVQLFVRSMTIVPVTQRYAMKTTYTVCFYLKRAMQGCHNAAAQFDFSLAPQLQRCMSTQ